MAPAQALTPADAAAAAETAAQHPSIAYEEAMAHEADRIDFAPGGRVDVAFTPRTGDAWPIDGKGPVALPGGRASGLDIARSPQGSLWANTGAAGSAAPPAAPDASTTPGPVDAPAGVPAAPAVGASYLVPAPAAPIDMAAATGLRRQVFGFLPYWELSGASTKLNYDVLSTIAYFSVGADGAGNLKKKNANGTPTTGWGGWSSSNMTSVIAAAHLRGTRVVLTVSVFAWTTAQATVQKALLGSAAARLNLAKQVAAAVRDRGADGVNLDFEPLATGYEAAFVAFIKTLRLELNKVHAGYQVTYDTTGYIGNYPLEASVAAGAADAIFVMGYDYRTSSSAYAGSIDPLSGPAYDLADTVRSYTARVAPSRVILGIPWYGRAWSTVSSAVRAKTQSNAKYGYSAPVNYENVVALVASYGRRWDSVEQSPYVAYQRANCTTAYGCVTSWRQVYYDDAASMSLRYALVNDYGLRGAGMWALGYEGSRSELYRAISDSFLVDKAAPQAGITTLASTQGDEGFVVTWAARDVSAIASYDVQVSTDAGAWADWLLGTKAASDVFRGREAHQYAFRVRARDAKGNVGAWNVTSTGPAGAALAVGGFGRVTADGLAYRTGPGTAAAKLGTLPLNAIVAITRGPVSADGYSWWEVTEPIREWGPVSFVERGVWIAGSTPAYAYVTPYRAPNSTIVHAGIVGLDFGAGASAVGTTPAALSVRQLSPNGDGSGDTLRLRWTNTLALGTLQLNVYRADGTLVGSQAVPALAAGARTWDWNGRAGAAVVPNGRYMLQLVGTAASGTYRAPSARPVTTAQVAAYGVLVDTVAPVISSASVSAPVISPNGDGLKDTVRLALAASGATGWTVQISSPPTGIVRTVRGAGASVAFTWNGSGDAGLRVPDGAYRVDLYARDDAGNSARRAFTVIVDTTRAAVSGTVSTSRFSPDGDGVSETTRLGWSSTEAVSGTARIWKGTTLIRSWTVTPRASWAVTWDGRNAVGIRVADGTYTFKVDVRDSGGNRTVMSRVMTMDRTAGWLRWSRSFFPQDGDALTPTAVLSYRLARTASTTLRLYNAAGVLVRTVWTARAQVAGTRTWTWNGKLANGTYVPQGLYRAQLTATSALGTTVLNRNVWVAGFAVTPSATTVTVGQVLVVRFSTIEPLLTRPVVTFTQPGLVGVTVTATRLANGTYSASFTVRAGAAGAGSIRISAKDSGGHANATTVGVTIAR